MGGWRKAAGEGEIFDDNEHGRAASFYIGQSCKGGIYQAAGYSQHWFIHGPGDYFHGRASAEKDQKSGGGQNPDQNHDKQLCQKRPAAPAGKKEVQ